MDDRDDMELAADGSSRVQRACDSCRARKIRCDRATPCSNCRASKLNCQTTVPTQKAAKQRVHISNEYEKKIDRIEDRLSGIETLLQSLAAQSAYPGSAKDPSESRSSHSLPTRLGRSPGSIIEPQSTTPAPFEGETAPQAQTEYARAFLARAVGNTPSLGQNAELQSALAAIQSMATGKMSNADAMNEAQSLFRADVRAENLTVEVPTWNDIHTVLEKAINFPTMHFSIVFPFLKIKNMRESLKQTYDAGEASSFGRRIFFYGCFYPLFQELAHSEPAEETKKAYLSFARYCKVKLESAMCEMDLLLPSNKDNMLAMISATAYSVELGKPSVCFILTTTAVRICHDLGYHRASTMVNDSEDERTLKVGAFWFFYMLDKALALRLGRASAIQDWDMDIPYPMARERPGSIGPGDIQMYWLKLARVQGETYEKLFSPGAFAKSDQERAQASSQLVDTLDRAWAEREGQSILEFQFGGSTIRDMGRGPNDYDPPSKRASPKQTGTPQSLQSFGPSAPKPYEDVIKEVGDIFYHADAVVHYSNICLIQRAICPDGGSFSQECLLSARAALRAHQRCSEQFNNVESEELWSGYVHWATLQAPFTPFTVIFCHAIGSCNYADLNQLAEFVVSLETVRSVSEAAEKLYRMCHLFLAVAKLYVEAHTSRPNEAVPGPDNNNVYDLNQNAQMSYGDVNQFDPYLSALGLTPQPGWTMASYPPTTSMHPPPAPNAYGSGFEMNSGSMNQVQDWFSGSRYMLNLLESDVNMPDFPNM